MKKAHGYKHQHCEPELKFTIWLTINLMYNLYHEY